MKTPMVSPRQIKYTNCVEAKEVRRRLPSYHGSRSGPLRAAELTKPRHGPRTAHQGFFGTSATSRIEVDNASS